MVFMRLARPAGPGESLEGLLREEPLPEPGLAPERAREPPELPEQAQGPQAGLQEPRWQR